MEYTYPQKKWIRRLIDFYVKKNYLIYFMKLIDLKEASKLARKSKHSIDQYHHEFQILCWEHYQNLVLLVDFDRYAESYKNE